VVEPPMLQKSLGGQHSLGWIVPLEMVIFPLEMVIFHSYVDGNNIYTGWWLTYPSEKSWSESQLGLLFPIYSSKPPTR